jgi:hypothetical protein
VTVEQPNDIQPGQSGLRKEVRAGSAARLDKLAVCAGETTLSPEDFVEILAILTTDANSAIAERAITAIQKQPDQAILAAIGRSDADSRLVQYCAAQWGDKPAIADSLAKNPQCTTETLIRLAPHFTQAGVQAVLDDLSRLTTTELAKALAGCPAATAEQKELLQETEKGEIDVAVLAEALETAEPDAQKRTTLLQRITKMNVVQRVQLALKGGREERNALIRDPNKMVQRAVLQSPRLVDRDVESFAAMTTLSTDTLRLIAARRSFMKNYVIVKGLINNSKTPVSVTMHLLPRLTATDLKMLTTNKNIPEVLRNTALKMYRQRNTRPS